jgi:hypothetical protein
MFYCLITVKNRHHTALLIQNNELKLLIRKGPLATDEKVLFESEWIWKLAEINDDQWHSYKFLVNYPTKVRLSLVYNLHISSFLSFFLSFLFSLSQIDLYIDEKLVITSEENFQIVKDHPLTVIPGTDDTLLALGACWHGKNTTYKTLSIFSLIKPQSNSSISS